MPIVWDLGSGKSDKKQPTIRHASGSPLYRWSFASVAVVPDQEARWLQESFKLQASSSKLDFYNNRIIRDVEREKYGNKNIRNNYAKWLHVPAGDAVERSTKTSKVGYVNDQPTGYRVHIICKSGPCFY